MSESKEQVQPAQQFNQETPISIAKIVRYHKELKLRKGLFQSKPVDFFRYKRFIRSLKSIDYYKKSKSQPNLYPPVILENEFNKDNDYDDDTLKLIDLRARNIFILLIKTQLIVPVIKLHSNELKQHNLKPNKDYPNLILSNKAILQPDQYYVWNFDVRTWWDTFMGIGVIALLLALVAYPLWPPFMRRGSYYISMGSLILLGIFFTLAILRLILYLITLPIFSKKNGLWIFPNLFEDCGVFESFKPFYGFGDKETYSYIKKMKRKSKKKNNKDANNKVIEQEQPLIEEIKQNPKIEEIKQEVDEKKESLVNDTKDDKKPLLEDVTDEHNK